MGGAGAGVAAVAPRRHQCEDGEKDNHELVHDTAFLMTRGPAGQGGEYCVCDGPGGYMHSNAMLDALGPVRGHDIPLTAARAVTQCRCSVDHDQRVR